jgi:DNA polymerase III epsilon subunit-like protein
VSEGQNPVRFLGCDIETTGSDFTDRIKTINIGVYDLLTGDLFRSDIGWPEGSFDMVSEASAVHGITKERILSAPSALSVEMDLDRWLDAHGVGLKRGIAIGFNVGVFDMPFIRRDLPVAAARFSYRCIDLNAVCFALAESLDVSWMSVKEKAKKAARNQMVFTGSPVSQLKPHDGGWDAMEAALAYKFLVVWMRGKP